MDVVVIHNRQELIDWCTGEHQRNDFARGHSMRRSQTVHFQASESKDCYPTFDTDTGPSPRRPGGLLAFHPKPLLLEDPTSKDVTVAVPMSGCVTMPGDVTMDDLSAAR